MVRRIFDRTKTGGSSQKTQSLENVEGIEFVLTRKNVKNLNIRIQPSGTVCVSAPKRMPLADIRKFVLSKARWISRVKSEYDASPMIGADAASDAEVRSWRNQVALTAPPLVEKWESVLGVHVNNLVYRNMKSRWGSCQPETGRVCLNTRLALYPPECLEYVVVHELCHLLVRGHGSDFHELMDSALPDWKARRSKLR